MQDWLHYLKFNKLPDVLEAVQTLKTHFAKTVKALKSFCSIKNHIIGLFFASNVSSFQVGPHGWKLTPAKNQMLFTAPSSQTEEKSFLFYFKHKSCLMSWGCLENSKQSSRMTYCCLVMTPVNLWKFIYTGTVYSLSTTESLTATADFFMLSKLFFLGKERNLVGTRWQQKKC